MLRVIVINNRHCQSIQSHIGSCMIGGWFLSTSISVWSFTHLSPSVSSISIFSSVLYEGSTSISICLCGGQLWCCLSLIWCTIFQRNRQLCSVIWLLLSMHTGYCLLLSVSTTLLVFVHCYGYDLSWFCICTHVPTWRSQSRWLCILYCFWFSRCLFTITVSLNSLISLQYLCIWYFLWSIRRWPLIVQPYSISAMTYQCPGWVCSDGPALSLPYNCGTGNHIHQHNLLTFIWLFLQPFLLVHYSEDAIIFCSKNLSFHD